MPSNHRARTPRHLLRAALTLACAASGLAALAAEPALGAPLISLGGSSSGVGVSIGETHVGVSLPSVEGAPSVPEVKASVGGGESSSKLVEVSVGGQPVVEVPNPVGSAPAPQPPPVTIETPSGTPAIPSGSSGRETSSGSPKATIADAGSSPARGPDTTLPRRRTTAVGGHSSAERTQGARRTQGANGGVTAAAASAGSGASGTARAGDRPPATSIASSSGNPLDVLGRNIPLPLPVPDWSKPIILALLLIALAFAVRSQLASRRARRLEGQRETLQRDVEVMQAALVPEVPAQLGGLSFTVAYRPADGPAAGGDFYDVFAPSPDRVAVVLGDVAGHGFSAVEHAALTRYTLRAYLQAGLEPRAALALAGKALADHAEEVLATVAVGLYDADSATFTYALAGHPPPIMSGIQARESVSICCSPPLGWSVPTGRRQRTLSLPAGAQLCFFSDGLIEARCALEGEGMLLGRERLRELLAAQLGPEPSAPALLASVGAAAIATPDDMAACILTSHATARGELLDNEELEVDESALAAGTVHELLAAWEVPSAEIDRCLREAAAIAAGCETAILRVQHAPHAGRVTVAQPVIVDEASPPRLQAAVGRAPAASGAAHATLVN